MSTLIAAADGNLTGSTTFAAADTGSLSLVLNRAGTTAIAPATSQTSSTFTITNGKVIDAVLLWVYLSGGVAAGTFKIDLQKSGVSQGSVTVNKADLPDSTNLAPVPVLFKLGNTVTGDGTASWTVVITTTGATGNVTYSRASATVGDFTRALRTTTTQAPVAADDLYIVGELTGTGTHNSRTVTMNSTAATVYGNGSVNSTSVNGGGIRISSYGTLSYGTAASTNYILQVNGDVEVFWNGTLNIGSSGSEIPRSSTAELRLQMTSANGDFGLIGRNGSTVNIAGLSRTLSKNVAKAKLTSSVSSTTLISSFAQNNLSINGNANVDVTGVSLLGWNVTDNTTNANHLIDASCGTIAANTTQSFTAWIARGTNTNNRFLRIAIGNAANFSNITNGYYVDLDLQAGTSSSITNIGSGSGTSVSLTALNGGYLLRLVGIINTGASSPSTFVNIHTCSALGTLAYAGTGSGANFYLDHVAFINGTIADTTFNINTDTGWLSGDAVCIAATSRSYQECETVILDANAASSSFTTNLYPWGNTNSLGFGSAHLGVSPLQAEVGLITRNVKIHSTSSSLWSYVLMEPLATLNASWAEFYYLGFNSSTKYGIVLQVGPVANVKNISYCSIHDTWDGIRNDANGTATSVNMNISNNVFWNQTNVALHINLTITNSDWVFDNNLSIRTGSGFVPNDLGGTFTNNTVASAANQGWILQGSAGLSFGTWSGNVVHSTNSYGIWQQTGFLKGTIDSTSIWHCNQVGINSAAGTANSTSDQYWTNLTILGCTAGFFANGGDIIHIAGGTISGTSSFNCLAALDLVSNLAILDINNVDMSGTGTNLASNTTADIWFNDATGMFVTGTVNGCKFGTTPISAKTPWTRASYLSFEQYNQTNGDHRTEMALGQLKTDASIYDLAAPSMRMTPTNSVLKLESAPKGRGKLVTVANGASKSVSVKVRKSVPGDGGAYNGKQPRLVQRANPALGQNSDIVLASASNVFATCWNSDDNSGMTISGADDLTATSPSNSNNAIRSTNALSSGKAYFEVKVNHSVSSLHAGIANLTTTPTAIQANNQNCGAVYVANTGNINNGSTNVASIGTVVLNDVVCIAIDIANHLLWMRLNGGNWNGSVSADPASGTGGISFAGWASDSGNYAAIVGGGTSDSAIANFGASSFAQSVPSGFSSWNTVAGVNNSGLPSSLWETLTGTTSVPTDDGCFELIVDCDGNQGFVNVDDW